MKIIKNIKKKKKLYLKIMNKINFHNSNVLNDLTEKSSKDMMMSKLNKHVDFFNSI